MTSRERMLAALNCEKPGQVPCAIWMPAPEGREFKGWSEHMDWRLEQGVDVVCRIPSLPIRFAEEVTIREWKDRPEGSPCDVIHREYQTPAGNLTAAAYQSQSWRYGDHMPLYSDYLSSHSVEYLITQPSDLAAFQYLLAPPTDEDIAAYRANAARHKQYAEERDVLLAVSGIAPTEPDGKGGFLRGCDGGTMLADVVLWLCGQEALMWPHDQPEFFRELMHMMGAWNRKRIEIMLEPGVDVIVKRAWYEAAPFYSPATYREFILPEVRTEADLIHQAGAKLEYHVTTGLAPFIDLFVEAGIDFIPGVDPAPSSNNDFEAIAQRAAGRIALGGGLSFPEHLEGGTPETVRQAVQRAIGTFGPNGGFILDAVGGDCIRPGEPGYPPPKEYYEKRKRNARTIIEVWRELLAGIP